MEIFRFDRDERRFTRHGSVGLLATRIATSDGPASVTQLKVEPGGLIGTHPAASAQLFLLVAGEGWVAGPAGARTPIAAGQGVLWDESEDHTSGTETGFTALVVEGATLALFAPEP